MNQYDDIINSVRSLAKGGKSEIDISSLLYKHKCFYLLSKTDKAHEYKAEMTMNQICILERYKVCRNIFEAFEANEISYAVIKGAVLSKSTYGDVNLRKSGDIDLLVSRKNIDIVKKIMLDNGFAQGRVTDNGIETLSRRELLFQSAASHQVAPFIKNVSNLLCPYVNVDINMDIFWGESERKSDMDFLLSYTENEEICGVRIRKLTTEMEFISLCMHHYKDMNSIYLLSQGSLKLFLFCDIYFYLRNNKLDLNQLQALCEKLAVSEYVYYCIFYANEIFQDDLLSGYLTAFDTEKARKALNTFGLAKHEIKIWNISFLERLFIDFPNDAFFSLLTEKDLEKINLNRDLM
jgi:hypothetical protein